MTTQIEEGRLVRRGVNQCLEHLVWVTRRHWSGHDELRNISQLVRNRLDNRHETLQLLGDLHLHGCASNLMQGTAV